ncbi:MAG: hypothetical protein GY703_01530 [Gammaproteobacteria bacterium]|nr:hypothetical protein [Gammaproteobacteria bacterium]
MAGCAEFFGDERIRKFNEFIFIEAWPSVVSSGLDMNAALRNNRWQVMGTAAIGLVPAGMAGSSSAFQNESPLQLRPVIADRISFAEVDVISAPGIPVGNLDQPTLLPDHAEDVGKSPLTFFGSQSPTCRVFFKKVSNLCA